MPSISHYFSLRWWPALISTGAALAATLPPPDLARPVTLSNALRWAAERDPQLDVWRAEAEVFDGQIEQALTRPNPVVGAEVENVIGSGPFQGIDGMELTLSVSQVLERSEKRDHRAALARQHQSLTQWNRELRLAALETKVRAAFVDLLITQETISLRRDQLSLATANRDETAKLVEAARSPTVELTRAELAVRQQAFALAQEKRAADTARANLALQWGLVSAPEFEIEGNIQVDDVPDLETLLAALPRTAALGRFSAEASAREAGVALAEVEAKPDFEVFGGARYFNETDGDAALVVGIQIPWTLADRNRGNIRSAQAQLRAVEHRRAATQRALMQSVAEAHRELVNAAAEYDSLEHDLRPIAEQTLAETQTGYERGQFNLLAVLESRSALFEIRESRLAALSRYARSLARIEALIRPANLTL